MKKITKTILDYARGRLAYTKTRTGNLCTETSGGVSMLQKWTGELPISDNAKRRQN